MSKFLRKEVIYPRKTSYLRFFGGTLAALAAPATALASRPTANLVLHRVAEGPGMLGLSEICFV